MDQRDQNGRFVVGSEPGPGRPCGYAPSMDEQVYKLSLLGMTDEQMARFFDVSRNTFHRWKTENSGFRDAIQRGKEIADAEVAHALFKRATGMRIVSEKAMKGPDGSIIITQTVTELPPDSRAASHWLANRRRTAWTAQGQKSEMERSASASETPERKAIRAMSQEEIQARIKVLQERRRIERNG